MWAWSDAKIERWLEDQRASHAAQRSARRRAEGEELEQGVGLILRILEESAGELGLLLHEYSGGHSEPITLAGAVRCSAGDVSCQLLRNLQPDRFYFILSD